MYEDGRVLLKSFQFLQETQLVLLAAVPGCNWLEQSFSGCVSPLQYHHLHTHTHTHKLKSKEGQKEGS